ncbi:MAG: type II secretion system F family protein [Syntrophomonadaceae bacterium]|nr:type II secretion system F family protein [Syntrophomonadaceae bacterium]
MKYSYQVRNEKGHIFKGFLEGEDEKAVIESLLRQNYYILQLKEIKESKLNREINFSLNRVSNRELILVTRQLATMLKAGLPILRCLRVLIEQTPNPKLKRVLSELSEDIEAGSALWQALAKHPAIFSNVYISMVKAGELGGVLDTVLEKLTGYLERENEINSKLKSASVYPIFISFFALLVVFFIISFVMPTFVGIFAASGAELPGPTKALLATGEFLKQQWLYILTGLVILFFLIKQWGKTELGRYYIDYLYLKLPIIGKALRKVVVARFARTMGTLIRSGITVVQALEVVEEVVGNKVVANAIRQARVSITEGDSITVPLQRTRVFEPIVYQMIAVGEEIGALDDMLVRISDYFEEEVMYTIESLMALIEPALIIFVALVVGGVVVATLMPMFEIIGTVGGM